MAAKSKKDFDKEYIFNLIMPSGAEPEPEEEPEEQAPVPEAEPEVSSEFSLLRQKLSQAVAPAVQLRPVKELVLVNLMERQVIDRLDEAFSKFNCCRCDKCRQNVAALALNMLSPRYVVADPETLPRLLEECDSKDVSAALVKAILQVKNHPKH